MIGVHADAAPRAYDLPGPLPVFGDYGRWFRERATVFTRFDPAESRRLSERSGAEVRQCYANCARNAYGYDYYEGFAWVLDTMWVDHAFLVKGGVVVDPTLAIGNRLEDGTVFAGIHFENPMRQAVALRRFEPLLLKEYTRYAGSARAAVPVSAGGPDA